METKVIESTVLGHRRSISIKKPNKDLLNISKQNLAIVPNIIHTLDAANVTLVIKDYKKLVESQYKMSKEVNLNFDLVTIHDCFGSHANNINVIKEQVKLAFIKLYSPPYGRRRK